MNGPPMDPWQGNDRPLADPAKPRMDPNLLPMDPWWIPTSSLWTLCWSNTYLSFCYFMSSWHLFVTYLLLSGILCNSNKLSQSVRARILISCRDLERRDWVAYLLLLATCRLPVSSRRAERYSLKIQIIPWNCFWITRIGSAISKLLWPHCNKSNRADVHDITQW